MKNLDFAIWDFKKKKRITIDNYFKEETVLKEGSYQRLQGFQSVIGGFFDGLIEILNDNNFKILLFTGKKDINGNKIYEYDLVENPGKLKGVVLYNENECKYEILWETNFKTDICEKIKTKGSIMKFRNIALKFRWFGLKGV